MHRVGKRLLKKEKRDENIQIIGMAVGVGIFTGITSIVFNKILNFFHYLIFEKIFYLKNFSLELFIVPILGGIVVGIINRYFIGKGNEGFGVSYVMEEIKHINTFLMKPKGVFIKIIGTIVTLGTGLSAGRFGPIVHLGGAIGSNIGYRFKFNKTKIRILIGCGVAGSMAGVFNSPIGATIFVLEILMNKNHLEYFAPIIISSISSVIVTRSVIGNIPFFILNGDFGLLDYKELIFYALLGIFLGVISSLYIKSIVYVKEQFKKLNCSILLHPFIGASFVAGVGYFAPLIYDIRYDTISRIICHNFTIEFMLILFVGKFIATAITLGSGGIGGVFLPGLYIGAAFGKVFAIVITLLFPEAIYNTSTYALIGMGAMFAGFADAPITATIMLTELTKNYEMNFAILIACTVSSVITKVLHGDSIYIDTLKRMDE